jgi:hypothetical protein
MNHQEQLYQWNHTLARHLPCLSKTQAQCLALWTFGMVLARSCSLSAVVPVLAALFGDKPDNLRQRLREFYKDAAHKAGDKRQTLQVETCFGPLLRWVLSWWHSDQIALALDATSLGDRFVVLVISVLYRGCAIPVAWCVTQAAHKRAWRKEWLRLLRLLGGAIPATKEVIVLADRGLYARWLFHRIVRLGWHPLLRVNSNCTFSPASGGGYRPMGSFVGSPGMSWSGRGIAFRERPQRLECTLLAFYGEGHKDPWLLVTDLPPENADVCWYGLRTWIEQGFKFLKRSGWQWNHTRMRDPERAARLWLATSVATLWLLSEGDAADLSVAVETFGLLTLVQVSCRPATRLCRIGIFHAGWICILVHLLRQEPLPTPQLVPEPWPMHPPPLRQTKSNNAEQRVAA